MGLSLLGPDFPSRGFILGHFALGFILLGILFVVDPQGEKLKIVYDLGFAGEDFEEVPIESNRK